MSETLTIYKIRHKKSGEYSRGRVEQQSHNPSKRVYGVNWKRNGKEWATEKAVKQHLLTCIVKGVDFTDWEIMEFTQQPSKELTSWFDAKMTFAVLKA